MDSQSLLKLLRDVYDHGFLNMHVRSYSGRGMYGEQCIAVVVPQYSNVWDLAVALTEAAHMNDFDTFELGSPNQDNMGRGQVYYWPSLKWPADAEEIGDDD